jgi:peptide deformylase
MIKNIVTNLKELTLPNEIVTKDNTPNLSEIIQDLKDTLIANPTGIGLSANQIGVHKKISYIRYIEENKETKKADIKELVMINPKILVKTTKVRFNGEGCLSFPGLHLDTNRYMFIMLEYQDETLETKQEIYQNIWAIAVQHELQHINSRTFLDAKYSKK